MQTDNWKKVKDLLDDVLRVEVSERRKFLDESNIDGEIRAEIESLIEFESEAEDLMRLTAVEFSRDFFDATDGKNLLIGQDFGIYRTISELGYGGMGAVYLAERTDGKFEQKVALKLLKREMNTAALRRRFEQERTILASLEHPNIARLLDAGTTADQIPFLAMEYVEGLPVDDYCSQKRLDLNQRLDLFRKICDAVNFAHRNLIVHRDLKPSNILVTEDGIPKLLDFGISKIISPEYGQINAATVTKLGVMTPSYASPEQLQNKSVTTATDIYSLGVILYELLSGHRPFEAQENDFKEIYRAVIEDEPTLPSSAVNRVSKHFPETGEAETEIKIPKKGDTDSSAAATRANKFRRTFSPQTIDLNSNSLRGDLDNIILKTLRKEPERRYSSVENFAEDIHRHQRGLPVSARPNTFAYRAGKFVRRNTASVVAFAFIVLAIIGGIAATLWQASIARAERVKAERRFDDVRKLANSYLFEVYPEIENLEGSLKAREKIITNALQYLDSLSNEAAGDMELQGELATAYEKIGDVLGAQNISSLGNTQAGLDSYGKARILREAILAANPDDLEAKEKLANNYYVIARTLWNNSQTAEAEAMFEEGIKLRRELVAKQPDSPKAKDRLAVMLIDYGAIPVFNSQTDKALVLFNEALEIIEGLRRQEPENIDFDKTLARLLRVLSKAKGSKGDYEGAISGINQAIAISLKLAQAFPKEFRIQRAVWLSNNIKCEILIDKADGQGVVEACLPTIDFPKTALEKEPENGVVAYDLAISHFNTARAYRLEKKAPQAIEQAEKAIAVMSKLSGESPENFEYKRNLAVYATEIARNQIELKQSDRVISNLHKVIQTLTQITEADQATTTNRYDLSVAYRMLAQAFFQKNEKQKAVESVDRAIALIRRLAEENAIRDTDKNLISELENERSQYVK